MNRYQVTLNLSVDEFIDWFRNELFNLPPEFFQIKLSEYENKNYYLEPKVNLFHKENNNELFLSGNLLEDEKIISECLLIRIKTFLVRNDMFILEISSEIEYQDIKFINKTAEEQLLFSIFGGINTNTITLKIKPLLDWLKWRIRTQYCLRESTSNRQNKVNQNPKMRPITLDKNENKKTINLQTKPAGRKPNKNYDIAFEYYVKTQDIKMAFNHWCEIEGSSNPDKYDKDKFKSAMKRREKKDELNT